MRILGAVHFLCVRRIMTYPFLRNPIQFRPSWRQPILLNAEKSSMHYSQRCVLEEWNQKPQERAIERNIESLVFLDDVLFHVLLPNSSCQMEMLAGDSSGSAVVREAQCGGGGSDRERFSAVGVSGYPYSLGSRGAT